MTDIAGPRLRPQPMSLAEFARRLCAREHPLFSTTGASVPCGRHIALAGQYATLVTSAGDATLKVILEVRSESGLKVPNG